MRLSALLYQAAALLRSQARASCIQQEAFLEQLEGLRPDLCVTAAYGNVLPRRFLAAPRCGTLNIHPRLLPQYRGAAPVQRALQV
jgi:methionyl-tRNA formyltransferase